MKACKSVLTLVGLLFLVSCPVDPAIDPTDNDPVLDFYAAGASLASLGVFDIFVYSIENTGLGDATHIQSELHIYGNLGGEVPFTFTDYSSFPQTLKSQSTYDGETSFSGQSIYQPWYFKIIVNYQDVDGNPMEPRELSQQFTVF